MYLNKKEKMYVPTFMYNSHTLWSHSKLSIHQFLSSFYLHENPLTYTLHKTSPFFLSSSAPFLVPHLFSTCATILRTATWYALSEINSIQFKRVLWGQYVHNNNFVFWGHRKACSSEWRNHFLSVPNNSKNGVHFLNIFGSQKFFFFCGN